MSQENDNVVRLRGLPWTTGSEDIIQFLEGCSINDVHFIYTKEGKPSGEAYVELNSEDDFNLALTKNQQYLGKRYIDVFAANSEEMEWAVKKSGVNPLDSNEDAVVRLRGLPFSCDRENLLKFFDGLPVTPNGVSLMTDPMGNATGEAFVQFANQSVADVALKKHMERIGHRYIEIFKSSLQEARTAIADAHRAAQDAQNCYQRDFQPMGYHPRRSAPYERPSQRYDPYGRRDRMRSYAHNDYYEDVGYPPRKRPQFSQRGRPQKSQNSNFVSQTGFSVFMRGLPFSATEADIMDFFSPVVPSSVVIERDHEGRNKGEAHVDFVCKADANQAMTRDRAPMKHRYIELFYTGREGHYDSDGHNNNWNAF